jgi:hypothetical protein
MKRVEKEQRNDTSESTFPTQYSMTAPNGEISTDRKKERGKKEKEREVWNWVAIGLRLSSPGFGLAETRSSF